MATYQHYLGSGLETVDSLRVAHHEPRADASGDLAGRTEWEDHPLSSRSFAASLNSGSHLGLHEGPTGDCACSRLALQFCQSLGSQTALMPPNRERRPVSPLEEHLPEVQAVVVLLNNLSKAFQELERPVCSCQGQASTSSRAHSSEHGFWNRANILGSVRRALSAAKNMKAKTLQRKPRKQADNEAPGSPASSTESLSYPASPESDTSSEAMELPPREPIELHNTEAPCLAELGGQTTPVELPAECSSLPRAGPHPLAFSSKHAEESLIDIPTNMQTPERSLTDVSMMSDASSSRRGTYSLVSPQASISTVSTSLSKLSKLSTAQTSLFGSPIVHSPVEFDDDCAADDLPPPGWGRTHESQQQSSWASTTTSTGSSDGDSGGWFAQTETMAPSMHSMQNAFGGWYPKPAMSLPNSNYPTRDIEGQELRNHTQSLSHIHAHPTTDVLSHWDNTANLSLEHLKIQTGAIPSTGQHTSLLPESAMFPRGSALVDDMLPSPSTVLPLTPTPAEPYFHGTYVPQDQPPHTQVAHQGGDTWRAEGNSTVFDAEAAMFLCSEAAAPPLMVSGIDLPSARRDAEPKKSSLQRSYYPREADPMCCESCGFFPESPGRRKKMARHRMTDKHRRITQQEAVAKLVCGGRAPDGSKCMKRFGRRDNLRQHYRKDHGSLDQLEPAGNCQGLEDDILGMLDAEADLEMGWDQHEAVEWREHDNDALLQ